MQQTSTFRRREFDPFYLKFEAEFNNFSPSAQKQQEVGQKLQKLRCGCKTYAARLSASKGHRRYQESSTTLEKHFFGFYL